AADQIPAAESSLPELVRQQADRRAVGAILVRCEQASARGADAQRREAVTRDAQRAQLFGWSFLGRQRDGVTAVGAERDIRRLLRLQILEARPRYVGVR